MHDLRAVALTSCIMKVFEKSFMPHINKIVVNFLDPYHYAYNAKRGVDDAFLHILNNIYAHIDKPRASILFMFCDFSSAFNTIQPHLLSEKLMIMNAHPSHILWVQDYLTSRPQVFVRLRPPSYFEATTCEIKRPPPSYF